MANVRNGWKADIDRAPREQHHGLVKRSVDPAYWPDHLRLVFRAIGRALGGKRLHPSALDSLPEETSAIVPGHRVAVHHNSKSAQPDRGAHYVVEIEGPALAGGWPFFSGELEQLARASADCAEE